MAADISRISAELHRYFSFREAAKESLEKLRRIAVEECRFDQEVVMKGSVGDLLDGYIKGVRAGQQKGQCGRINSGHACTMPAGSKCPDCGPSCHDVPEGA